MAGQKTISSSYQQPAAPLPPPPDLIVTGAITPNATGNYFLRGQYDGLNYYSNADNSFYIWCWFGSNWIFNTTLGTLTTNRWAKPFGPPTGNYSKVGTYIGTAIVSTP